MAAADAYRAVYQKFPDAPQADRARYMVGDCLYLLGDLKGALTEFGEVRSRDEDRVLQACAELRQGQCRFELEDYSKAQQHFQRVVDRYHDTYLARDAKFALAQTLVARGEAGLGSVVVPPGEDAARALGELVSTTLRAGLPETVCGQTINRFCSSGVQSIAIAAQQEIMPVEAGDGVIAILAQNLVVGAPAGQVVVKI